MKRLLTVLLALVSSSLLLLASTPKGEDQTLQDFKKYYKTYKVTVMRVEAVHALEGVEDPGVIDVLAPILKDCEPEVQRVIVKIFGKFKERPAVDRMLETLKSEKNDIVRSTLLEGLAAGKYPGCAEAITPLLGDKSWPVRRQAIKALAAPGDAAVAEKILPLCDDSEVAVRSDAIDALTAFNSPLVVPKAIVGINDGDRRVRGSSLKALGKIRHADSIEPLIARLAVEDGVLRPEIAEALANLTGNEFGIDAPKWASWWAENKAGYKLPTPDAIAYLRSHRVAKTGGSGFDYSKSGPVVFLGQPTLSKSILFVIDVSGSMEAEITEKDRFSDGEYPSFQRIDIVKTELMRVIERLEANVNFNIIAFATKVDPWKQKLMPANVLNKSAAKDWVKGLYAIGGASKADLATAGLVGSANLEMGKTNTFGALMAALNVKTGKDAPRTGGETKDYRVDVDTIFFLSDGRPTVGDFVDPDDILREVKLVNDLRKVVIHTIAIGEFQKDFMKKIAEQNSGVFVDLGR
ncbi:MAG: HEAT repeat domain-containing protein [Planctomycetes bacterium]|nr:HEAT repeat domain-containing protein [Planctomycetota bacterium]